MKGFIKSTKTFRYFTIGDPNKAKRLLYVLHGYAQLAEFFIKKFDTLSEEYFIVAPEGMHRFYLSGNSGRIGASWMTKEERENDIEDNINWLNQLDDELCIKYQFEKRIIFGFSQGGATAARWFYNKKIDAEHLIIWASVFPPDLEISDEIFFDNLERNIFLIGNNDQYYSKENQDDLIEFYKSKGFHTEVYQGDHEIQTDILQKVLRRIQH